MRKQDREAQEAALKIRITGICETSALLDWEVRDNKTRITSVKFRVDIPLTLATIQKIADALGTNEINFNFGDEGDPGYSEYTPGSPGHPGWLEIYFPEKPTEPEQKGPTRTAWDHVLDESADEGSHEK